LNEIKNGLADYVKDVYPDAKNVFYFTDIKNIDSEVLAFLREKMDMIGVFDPKIAQKWDLDYWPNVYPTVEHTSDEDNRYDLCFMGSDRGRKDILEKVAQKCKQHHIRTAFYIVSDEENPELDNIHYLKTPLAYEKVVDIMSKTNCILELRVEPYNSSSVRVQEAVVYDKKLLTNNPNSTTMPGCVAGENVLCFDSVEEIDWNFVTARKNTANHYQSEYSLQTSLEIIEQKLNER
jgi:hypothetical protein